MTAIVGILLSSSEETVGGPVEVAVITRLMVSSGLRTEKGYKLAKTSLYL